MKLMKSFKSIHWQYLLLFSLCYLSYSLETKAQGVSISPARIFFSGSSEHEYSQRVSVENSGSQSVIFKSSMKDWKRDSLGNKAYFPIGELPFSNASWVEVLPNVVEIPPHSKKEVNVLLHVPKDQNSVSGVSHSMLFLTQLNAQDGSITGTGKTKIGVLVKLEFGIHIYYTPLMVPVNNLEFIAFTNQGLTRQGQESLHRIAIKIKNSGNVVTDGFLRLELTNKTSGEEIKIPERALSMLPNDEQIIYLDLPANLKGSFLAIALMDSGEQTNLKVAKKDLVFN
jgi:hypothetical protein